jgi:elongation of very long chain fatty acids protein 7
MARAVWIYYMAKIIELLDTVFFVLRKKNSQVTFLHVYHHTLMPICSFIGVKFFAGKLPRVSHYFQLVGDDSQVS